MIRIDRTDSGRYRVIGSLRACDMSLLTEILSLGPIVCNLAEVERADYIAVRFLASLSPQRCILIGCPRWLALWIEQVRGDVR